MGAAAGEALGIDASQVLVCSTGIIGTPLPMDPILHATPKLAKKLSAEGGHDAARGILTTDHKPKEVLIKGSTFTIGGMAKGCGMIAPNMATMLAFLTTDADVPRELMQKVLRQASDATFNTLNVDGATSTNDTAMVLASGRRGKADPEEFANAVLAACEDLTMQMARDAEGMTRIARLVVTGAANDNEARIAAKNIVENNLVKCSWYGGDPYWGRLHGRRGLRGSGHGRRQIACRLWRDRRRQGRRRDRARRRCARPAHDGRRGADRSSPRRRQGNREDDRDRPRPRLHQRE